MEEHAAAANEHGTTGLRISASIHFELRRIEEKAIKKGDSVSNETPTYSFDDMKKLSEDLLQRVEKAALRTSPLIAAAALDFFADILPHLPIRSNSNDPRQAAEDARQAIINHALATSQMLKDLSDSSTI